MDSIRYRVVGKVGLECSPSYKWKDETNDYREAQGRLADAQKYSGYTCCDIHAGSGPQKITWEIISELEKITQTAPVVERTG